jgi:hypothetical protein
MFSLIQRNVEALNPLLRVQRRSFERKSPQLSKGSPQPAQEPLPATLQTGFALHALLDVLPGSLATQVTLITATSTPASPPLLSEWPEGVYEQAVARLSAYAHAQKRLLATCFCARRTCGGASAICRAREYRRHRKVVTHVAKEVLASAEPGVSDGAAGAWGGRAGCFVAQLHQRHACSPPVFSRPPRSSSSSSQRATSPSSPSSSSRRRPSFLGWKRGGVENVRLVDLQRKEIQRIKEARHEMLRRAGATNGQAREEAGLSGYGDVAFRSIQHK